jgi:hypothetical protein
MPALRRGEPSNCSNPELDVFFRLSGGVLYNIFSAEFIIQDMAIPATPVQVFPPSGREIVDVGTDCPAGGRITTGHYVAAYTPPLTATVGTHRIVWYYEISDGAEEQSWSQEFEILDEAIPSAGDGYVTIAEAQAKGWTEDIISPTDLAELISEASKLIDSLTGWWFEPRPLVLTADGNDGRTLNLHVPIIAIDLVKIDDEDLDSDSYVVYNRHLSENSLIPEDDRDHPRLERAWRAESGLVGDLYYRQGAGIWRAGQRNIEITGTFGYTDPPGPLGVTPPAIKRACYLLMLKLFSPVNPTTEDEVAWQDDKTRIKRERTRDQEREYFEGAGGQLGSAYGYLTGDKAIDDILGRYMAPPGMGVAKCVAA